MTNSAAPVQAPLSPGEAADQVQNHIQQNLASGNATAVLGQRDDSAVMLLGNLATGKVGLWENYAPWAGLHGKQIQVPIDSRDYQLNKQVSAKPLPAGQRLNMGWVAVAGGHVLVELDGRPTIPAYLLFPPEIPQEGMGNQTEVPLASPATTGEVAPPRTGKSKRRGRRGRRGGKAHR